MPSDDPAGTAIPRGQTFDPTNLAALRTALGDDEIVRDIVQTFLAATPGHIAALRVAEREGAPQAIAASAHLIKGSALTFGATRLVNLCATLEASPVEPRGLVAAVEQEFHELSRSLSSYVGELA